jgi:predicted Zn-dependent peptidase
MLASIGVLAALFVARGEASEFALENGLRVRLVPARGEKEVVVILGIHAGIFDEPAGGPHLAHVVEHVTVFGTASADDTTTVEKWFAAGRANAETLADWMYFDLRVPAEDLAPALRVQAARLAHAGTDAATLAREVPRALAELESLQGPGPGGTGKFALSALVQAALHGRREIAMATASRAFTPDDVREFQTRVLRPDRAVLSLVGDVDPSTARAAVEKAFAPIPKPKLPPVPRPVPKPGRIDASWDASTAHVLVAWPAPPAAHADHPALTAASLVLAQRLFADAEIGALAKLPLVQNDVDGFFLVNAQAKNPGDVEALEAKILDRVARLEKTGGVTDGEVRATCGQLEQIAGPIDVDTMPLPPNVSRSLARANIELQRAMRGAQWGDLAAYSKRLAGVDAKAVREAVARWLDAKKATIVRLRPSA